MYALQRIITHRANYAEKWEEHTIRKSSQIFYLTDKEFDFLQNLPKEYNYHEFDNEFYVDRHPAILEEEIDNQDFIDDYKNHLGDKFFVAYAYIQTEVDVDV